MRCYRIVKPTYAATALSGEGARLYGGRWNPPGFRCVYAAGSRALAVLELLVHLSPQTRGMAFRLLEIEVPDELMAPSVTPPSGWDGHPAGNESQDHGLQWLKRGKHGALRVPSVVIPQEHNVLLNPDHPGFKRIAVVGESKFQLDLRLAV
jgi:RES domain-containing protein